MSKQKPYKPLLASTPSMYWYLQHIQDINMKAKKINQNNIEFYHEELAIHVSISMQ
jgi:hypothetical protein